MDQAPSAIKKSSSGSSCSPLWKDPLPKKEDLTKFYKKFEKVSRRIFHAEKNPTFVPSAINSAQPSSSHETGVSPPYPVDTTFGSGFSALPTASSSQQTVPPSYGWALNGNTSSSTSSAMPLSLDIGIGDETAGSGYDHLIDNDPDSYLHVSEPEAMQKRSAQTARLNEIKKRIANEDAYLNVLLGDQTNIELFMAQNYGKGLENENTEALEKEIVELEAKLRHLRDTTPGVPPPRPPPPRSHSQDNSLHCPRCHIAMVPKEFRCRSCQLPSRKIDPAEAEICRCQYCS